MALSYSPLRYPGGKSRLVNFMKLLLIKNDLKGGTYAEPFAGGAGVAIGILLDNYVDNIIVNDVDPKLYAFWHTVLNETEELCGLIADTPVEIEEWFRQKTILSENDTNNLLSLGFATFFLNRTNRSGILNAGAIGGKRQNGKWKIDARYDKESLIAKIKQIAKLRNRITLTNLDVRDFIDQFSNTLPENSLVYFDPPYYVKGQELYLNALTEDDHILIGYSIKNQLNTPWLISYDNAPEISTIYDDYTKSYHSLSYSAAEHYSGTEVIISSDGLKVPVVENPFRITKQIFQNLLKAS